MIAYKVFHVQDGQLRSMNHDQLPLDFRMLWHKGLTFVAPHSSYFFVFEHLHDALRWMEGSSRELVVWKVEVPRLVLMGRVPGIVTQIQELMDFWKHPNLSYLGVITPPHGTFGTREVMLLEEVQ
jgi:hypothetical protein